MLNTCGKPPHTGGAGARAHTQHTQNHGKYEASSAEKKNMNEQGFLFLLRRPIKRSCLTMESPNCRVLSVHEPKLLDRALPTCVCLYTSPWLPHGIGCLPGQVHRGYPPIYGNISTQETLRLPFNHTGSRGGLRMVSQVLLEARAMGTSQEHVTKTKPLKASGSEEGRQELGAQKSKAPTWTPPHHLTRPEAGPAFWGHSAMHPGPCT